MPDITYYYIQHIGDKQTIINSKTYDLILTKYPQPEALSTPEKNVLPYDYTESDVNNTSESVVLNKEIIIFDNIKGIMYGAARVTAGFAVYGDKTEITGIEFALTHKRDVIRSKYVFASPVRGNADGYGDIVFASINEIVNNILDKNITLTMTISIIGRVIEEGAVGKVSLVHPRGSAIPNLVLSIEPIQKQEIDNIYKQTYTLNMIDVDINRIKTILDLDGVYGRIREITITSATKPNIYIYADRRDILHQHNTWDDLNRITDFSDTIAAVQSAVTDEYIINIKKIYFKNSIRLAVGISGSGTVSNVLVIYDLEG